MKDLNKTNLFSSNTTSLEKDFMEARKDIEFDNYIRMIRLPNEILFNMGIFKLISAPKVVVLSYFSKLVVLISPLSDL